MTRAERIEILTHNVERLTANQRDNDYMRGRDYPGRDMDIQRICDAKLALIEAQG